jgi:ATP-dependent Lhr-like helicase
VSDAAPLFSRENLIETMETWLADNAVMKRTFKGSAIIAGLIDRAMPGGKRKTGGRRRFPPTSSTTRCASTTPTT